MVVPKSLLCPCSSHSHAHNDFWVLFPETNFVHLAFEGLGLVSKSNRFPFCIRCQELWWTGLSHQLWDSFRETHMTPMQSWNGVVIEEREAQFGTKHFRRLVAPTAELRPVPPLAHLICPSWSRSVNSIAHSRELGEATGLWDFSFF